MIRNRTEGEEKDNKPDLGEKITFISCCFLKKLKNIITYACSFLFLLCVESSLGLLRFF